ncbi:MAG TPA: hypothetical protein VNN80_11020 [Polyangiaceae bacterium]|nr:hypothetical protein [Polyangiaceae bacterium]
MGPLWDELWAIVLAASFGFALLAVTDSTEARVIGAVVAVPVLVQFWIAAARRLKAHPERASWLRFTMSTLAPILIFVPFGVWLMGAGVSPALVAMPVAVAVAVPLWNWALPHVLEWMTHTFLMRHFRASLRSARVSPEKRVELERTFEKALKESSVSSHGRGSPPDSPPADAAEPEPDKSPDGQRPTPLASDVRELSPGSADGEAARAGNERELLAPRRSHIAALRPQVDAAQPERFDESASGPEAKTRGDKSG